MTSPNTHPIQPIVPNLAELLAKVEHATGPDWRLDVAIHCAMPVETYEVSRRPSNAPGKYVSTYRFRERVTTGTARPPHYTSSIDDAVRLIKKVRPGWHWEVARDNTAMVRDPSCDAFARADHVCWGNEAKTPALALLIALLRSLLSQTEGEAP